MRITLGNTLPPYPDFVEGIRRAPDRGYTLTPAQTITALKNALRYIPTEWHEQLAPELMEELRTRGRIYGYRFRPAGDLKAKPIDEYRGQCIEGKAFQVMIDNNLCFDIALYPYELVTYGETGQVLIEKIKEGIQEKKGKKIVVADLTSIEDTICKYFVICQGNSPSQVSAIVDSIKEFTRKGADSKPYAIDGLRNAEWVAMDYADVLVHVFLPETRAFYNLEHLWADAKLTQIPDLD